MDTQAQHGQTASTRRAFLSVNSINAYYGESYIVQNVSFSLNEGEILALLGRNGAGKTSTLRAIARMENPALRSGETWLDQKPLHMLVTQLPLYGRHRLHPLLPIGVLALSTVTGALFNAIWAAQSRPAAKERRGPIELGLRRFDGGLGPGRVAGLLRFLVLLLIAGRFSHVPLPITPNLPASWS